MITALPPGTEFRLPWRPYQARVLGELEDHLSDGRLHVVAAPGSGKTVLGLEVMRRLGSPALVLAPTLTIRDQWVQRFVDLFLPPGSTRPDWISTDLRKPGFLTVATYQALHCACGGEACVEAPELEEENGNIENSESDPPPEQPASSGEAEVVAALRSVGVRTMIVDEAHHLRTNWWRTLDRVRDALGEITTVALTATPPYDVPQQEWERYRELCGPVDAEISAPELVLQRNLCPHQDYVYLNTPSPEEQKRLVDFRRAVDEFVREIRSNEEFICALESHPWLNFPEKHVEEILSDSEYFSGIAIFTNAVRGHVPDGLLRVMGIEKGKLPALDLEWLEVLLEGRLFRDAENIGEWDPMLKLIRERLSKIGAIERRKVHLRSTPSLDRMLVSSANKLSSIAEIVHLEHRALGPDLRMVLLTDYIRKNEMPDSPQDEKPLSKIGVVPIFEKLRRDCPGEVRLGILSGSLVVVPASSEPLLRSICSDSGVDNSRVYLTPLFHDPRFCRLVIDDDLSSTVCVVTKLFSEGGITCLVGTKSLLGEGWDAPSVNSLILASFVGSFMLSNQMRGRAIRSESGNPEKTANVWHLVCEEHGSSRRGADMETLTRRFKAFVGVSFADSVIENGIDRLGLGDPPFSHERISAINSRMRGFALDRAGLRKRWEKALVGSGPGRMVEEVKTPRQTLPQLTVRSHSLNNLGVHAFLWAGLGVSAALSRLTGPSALDVFDLLAWPFGLAALAGAPFAVGAIRRMVKHSPPEGSLQQVGEAVLEGLTFSEAIKTTRSKLRVVAQRVGMEGAACALDGGTSYEASVFLEAMQEVLGRIDSPRYLICRRLPGYLTSLSDPVAVPHAIGQRKEWALRFLEVWRRRMGYGKLAYTRTVEGRKLLLQAREAQMTVDIDDQPERVSCWK